MDDPGRILSLRAVGMLRELARKWWRVEVGLADPAGRVLLQAWGPVPADGNDFCRAARAASGLQRGCLRSVREIQQRLRRNPRERSPLLHTCHLGLSMAAAAIRVGGRDRGLLFACGFSARELSRTRIARLRSAVGEPRGRKTAPHGERVPVLSREDVERLRDLLEYAADEVADFELGSGDQAPPGAPPGQAFAGIVACSSAMRSAVERLGRVAAGSTPVLLVGEPGTGKRALAHALHWAGPRRSAPWMVFEASPDPLASEHRLFGMARGGSLGRAGLIETASPGSLYLPAGSWSPPIIQVKLLRYLQEGTLVPVGGERPLVADTRLVLALEKEPDAELAAGRLRRDLAEQLARHRIVVPPLRERREDLAELIELLRRRQAKAQGVSLDLPAATVALLARYRWPGNVSELEEEIRQLALMAGDGRGPRPEHLSMRIRQAAGHGSQALTRALKDAPDLKRAVAILERELIHEGLVRTRWNKSRLARQLGISRSNLLAKMARYGLEADRKP